MAIQDLSSTTPYAPADPRRTGRAPFPARAVQGGDSEPFPQNARDELTSERLVASDRRTVARCPACGEDVLAGDDYVRDQGDLYHARCVHHRGEGDGGRSEPMRSSPGQTGSTRLEGGRLSPAISTRWLNC